VSGREKGGRCLLPLGLALLLLGSSSAGSAEQRRLSALHHTAFLAHEGAPSQVIALAQTTDGYIWIGSSLGLFRFDGFQFERYEPPGVPSHNIYALEEAPDGGLWISFRPSGLGYLKDGRIRFFTRPEELPSTEVYRFACGRDGRVWAATRFGLALFEGTRWKEIGPEWGIAKLRPPQRVTNMLADREGTLWVTVDGWAYSLKQGARVFEPLGRVGFVSAMTEAPDGHLWVSGEGAVRPLAGGTGIPLDSRKAEHILIDREGGLWVIAREEGIRRFRLQGGSGADAAESFRERDGLSGMPTALIEDREGNIWLGTNKGLDRFRPTQVMSIALPEGYRELTLRAGENGEVWIATGSDHPLLRMQGDEPFRVVQAGRKTSSVYRDPRGVVWWGGEGGLWRQRGDKFDYFSQPRDVPPAEWFWEVFGGDGEAVLVGVGDSGVFRFRDGVWSADRPAGLPDVAPDASFADAQGRTWLGYRDNRVALLDGDHLRWFSNQDGLGIGRIRVIRGRGSHLWFGGELGLALFQEGRFRTIRVAGRESFGTVAGIVEATDGSLWLNEMEGLIHITSDEVRKVVADPNHPAAVRVFDFLDGLPGAGQMNFNCSTAIEASDGKLWFATDNGLVRIDPAHDPRNAVKPPVTIRSVEAGGRSYDARSPVSLPSGTSSLRIDYTALSLSIPERVQFRYRLEGLDDDWRDAGTRRAAFYTKLPPGAYRFRVVASNNDGVWNETGAAVDLSIAPTFLQTRWFLWLCVASGGVLTWTLYRWRLRQVSRRMKLRFDERLAERTRIAQELHDTLLQGFVSASMSLHVAADQVAVDSPARPLLTRVLELMRIVIDEGRNAVRGLRTPQVESLEEALSRARLELNGPEAMDFRVVSEGEPRPLTGVVREEVYRIGREALANAFLHSGAARVEVEVEFTSSRLRVLIRDDGRGIEPSVLEKGREGHWGLKVMRERADRVGAKLRVWSRSGLGTEVEVTVPGTIAFRSDLERSGKKRWWGVWRSGQPLPPDRRRAG
jgi:signal transduction histidine kinase/ligand-binding sensor domain-containing protein